MELRDWGRSEPAWSGPCAASTPSEGRPHGRRGTDAYLIPATLPNPSYRHPQSVSLLLPHAQGVLVGVPLLSLGVTEWQEAGSRTGRTLLVRLCPLIRCFRQGGVHCGCSLPAHGCGVWQGQSSLALPSPPGGFAGSSNVGPACLHLHDIEDTGQNRFQPGGLPCPHPEPVPSLSD